METPKPRAKRRAVTLGPDLDRRLDAVRLARNPPPPYAALVRLMVERALPTLETAADPAPRAA